MNREECLNKAKEYVLGQRENEYGTPKKNFSKIAKLWSAYKEIEFSALDVAIMMSLLKIARIAGTSPTDDSFVDLAGYAACACEIFEESKAREKRN